MKVDAKAREVERVITETVTERVITLELTEREAKALRGLVGGINIPPDVENREIFLDLKDSLRRVIGWAGRVEFTDLSVSSVTEIDPDYVW